MHHVVLADGARIAYHDRGEGSPVLLLHGFTGTARGHLGPLINELSRDYRVVAPDLRGYGASKPPQRSFPADFYQRDAADMTALLDQLAIGPAIVLGFSDGAEVALLMAAMRPELVRGVISWGVAGVIVPAMIEAVQDWLPVEQWGPTREAWRQEIIVWHGEGQLKPMVEGWIQAARAILAAGGNICLVEAAQIRCPVLLINGENEVGNPPDAVKQLAANIADCRLEFMAESGHPVHEHQPERFLAIVRSFLQQVDGA
jgi:valacyclovir hydrolase